MERKINTGLAVVVLIAVAVGVILILVLLLLVALVLNLVFKSTEIISRDLILSRPQEGRSSHVWAKVGVSYTSS